MSESYELVSDFLAAGGDVLKIIFVVTFLLWVLIIERFIFYKYKWPELLKEIENSWQERADKGSWFAHRVREFQLSTADMALQANIGLIKTLVALCPLLGLLGTVSGMIAVFDVMALTGTGNARLMASGISLATIPTMAGMVTALSGLYFGNLFAGKSSAAKLVLEENLPLSI